VHGPQQACLDDAFGGQPPCRAAQPLDRPVACSPPVQDPHDVTPGLVRTHPPRGRQPRVQLCQNAFEIGGLATAADLADRVRIPCPQAGIAADASTLAGGLQARLGALGDQRPFEMGDSVDLLSRLQLDPLALQ
jgi:hypothetical protein